MFYFLPMSRLDTDNTSFLQFCCIGCQMFTLNFQLLCPTFCTDNCAVFRWLHCNVCLLAIIDLLVVSLHLNRSLVLRSSNSLFFLINLHLWVFPHPVLLSIVFETYFTKTPQFGNFYYCYGSITVTSTSQESVMFRHPGCFPLILRVPATISFCLLLWIIFFYASLCMYNLVVTSIFQRSVLIKNGKKDPLTTSTQLLFKPQCINVSQRSSIIISFPLYM